MGVGGGGASEKARPQRAVGEDACASADRRHT